MELLKEYLALCFFKNNPINLYPPLQFIWKNLLFYLGMGILVEANISDILDGTIEIIAKATITVIFIFLLLLFTKKLPLFIQMLTALIVCENFILFLAVLTEIIDVIAQHTAFGVITIIIAVDLALWYVAIVAYVFKQMFLFTTFTSMIMSMFYCLFTIAGAFMVTAMI